MKCCIKNSRSSGRGGYWIELLRCVVGRHRSQFGEMHKDIVRHFQNAQFFGFTGTPRFEVNGKVDGKVVQTTEKLFGECLHSYLIKDAIFDNNVLGFHIEYNIP